MLLLVSLGFCPSEGKAGSPCDCDDASAGAKRPRSVAAPVAAGEGGARTSPRKRSSATAFPALTGMDAAGPAAGSTVSLHLAGFQPAVDGHLGSSIAASSSRLCALHADLKALRDKLPGVEQGIEKKEAVKEVLQGKLSSLEEHLARPGLSAEDKRHLRARWQLAADDKADANAALADLRGDARRIKDDMATLRQRIAAEETARRKADIEVCFLGLRAPCVLLLCDFVCEGLGRFPRFLPIWSALCTASVCIEPSCVLAEFSDDASADSCASFLCVVSLASSIDFP